MTATAAPAQGFEAYVRERGDALWRAAWLLTGDKGHAEDLVQTALAKTWSRYNTFDNNHHFEAYVRTTIYRTYVSWWRKLSWRNETPVEQHRDAGTPDAHSELKMDMLRAMDTLPRMQRTVLVLRYFEDRSVAEVAELLGIPENTVKTHARRGCAAIRESVHFAQES
ncbi:MAG: SigE family RNA polymerase sigma factor [Propionibacteriaceae bacterium]|nr:SigE family RNA polymerase sigma factor [Propionibacteriaceae bacterium]